MTKTKRYTIRLTDERSEELQKLAKEMNIDISAVVNTLLIIGMNGLAQNFPWLFERSGVVPPMARDDTK